VLQVTPIRVGLAVWFPDVSFSRVKENVDLYFSDHLIRNGYKNLTTLSDMQQKHILWI